MTDGTLGVDPSEVSSRPELGRALSAAREAVGLTVRQVVTRSGGPHGTVASWFAGQHVPTTRSRPDLEAVLTVLGIGDAASQALWWSAVQRARASARRGGGVVPYRGLEAFGTGDAANFFGRERTTRVVVEEVLAAVADDIRTVVVVGSSGVGKSSLVRAGVVPALAAPGGPLAGYAVVVVTPGPTPSAALDTALADAQGPVLLVVDQLEEIFTQAAGPGEFLGRIGDLVRARDVVVLLVLRADFFAAASREPVLLPVLDAHQVVVGPMDGGELREAVTEPARRGGRDIEPELLEALLAGPAPRQGRTAADPGVLPLLSHALLATWAVSPPGRLTLAAYREAGSVEGAVAQTADRVFEELTHDEQQTARRVFLRLVTVDGAVVARRAATPDELVTAADLDRPALVTERFAAARLLTLGEDTVEVSHEALLEHWPRLRGWIEEYRDDAAVHHRITSAATLWVEADRAPDYLLRGARRDQLLDWADDPEHAAYLNVTERDLLATSEQAREVAEARTRRRSRRLLQLTGAAVTFGTLALVLALVAALAVGRADRQQAAAVESRDSAVAVQLAVQAGTLRARDPNLAAQLALAAYRTDPSPAARSALLDSSAGIVPSRETGAEGPMSIATTADGSLVAVARADGSVAIDRLDEATGVPRQVSHFDAGTGSSSLYATALDPAGRILAVAGGGPLVRLFDVSDPGAPRAIGEGLRGPTQAVRRLAFAPGDGQLAAASADGSVYRWRIGTAGEATVLPPVVETGPLYTALFTADGSTVITGASDGTVKLWDVSDPATVPTLLSTVPVGSESNFVLSLAISADGSTLAVGAKDTVVRQVDISDLRKPVLSPTTFVGLGSFVNSVQFSRDGTRVVAGSSDDRSLVWDRATGAVDATLPGPAAVTETAFVRDDRVLLTASGDGALRVWPLTAAPLAGPTGSVFDVGFSADGRVLTVGPGKPDTRVLLWDMSSPSAPRRLGRDLTAPPGAVLDGSSAIRPDGNLVASGTASGSVVLWDTSDPQAPRVIGAPLETSLGLVQLMDISADGRTLAAAIDPGEVVLWNIGDPTRPVRIATLDVGALALDVAISRDLRTVAVAGGDNTVHLWDLTASGGPAPLPALHGFTNTVSSVAFSPDSSQLLAGSYDRSMQVWDVREPRAARPVGRLTGPAGRVFGVSWSADGSLVAGASDEGSVWVWAVSRTGEPILQATLSAAGGEVFTAAFSPAGRTLVGFGAGDARTGRVWDVDPDAVAAQICMGAGAPITEAEWSTYAVGVPYSPPCA